MSAPPNFRLDGRQALVTGAGRGIGLAIAKASAAAGATVIFAAPSRDEIEEAAATIRQAGGAASALPLDVTRVAEIRTAIGTLSRLDILVNNSGTNRPKPMSDISEDDYDAVAGLNLRAALFAAQSAAGVMARQGGGAIFDISSQMGHAGAANLAIDAAVFMAGTSLVIDGSWTGD